MWTSTRCLYFPIRHSILGFLLWPEQDNRKHFIPKTNCPERIVVDLPAELITWSVGIGLLALSGFRVGIAGFDHASYDLRLQPLWNYV